MLEVGRGGAPTSLPDLESLLSYVLTSGGKRIRPAITLLAADFYPHDQEKPVIMAGAVELLHLATLIHDDMVDNSDLRRGKATVSNLWGKDVAVLFGDYLFATSATFVCDTGSVRVIRRFAETIMELASGEILEIFHAFDPAEARRRYQERQEPGGSIDNHRVQHQQRQRHQRNSGLFSCVPSSGAVEFASFA